MERRQLSKHVDEAVPIGVVLEQRQFVTARAVTWKMPSGKTFRGCLGIDVDGSAAASRLPRSARNRHTSSMGTDPSGVYP
jgi:hypothetical protein